MWSNAIFWKVLVFNNNNKNFYRNAVKLRNLSVFLLFEFLFHYYSIILYLDPLSNDLKIWIN